MFVICVSKITTGMWNIASIFSVHKVISINWYKVIDYGITVN